ncbi:MAG: MFS transporter [Hyphomicrobiales bacterium]|nr:MFS transporter [Hyphomicrobiales bacterium]
MLKLQSYYQFIHSNFRWLLGGFLLTMFSSFGQTFFISLSTGHVRKAFDLTSGEYGSIYMVATLASALTLTFFGRIVDYMSIAKTAIISTSLLALACIGFAQANSLIILVISLYGLRLLGQGMMTHISITAMGRWYAKNRGKAISIVSIGFNVGLAILPVAFIGVSTLISWRHTWLLAAAILVLIAIPAITALLRQERTARGVEPTSTSSHIIQWTSSQMLRDPIFWIAVICLLGPPFISTAIFFHQDYLFTVRNWSVNLFAWTFVMMTLISVLSGLVTGIAIDRFSTIALLPLFLVPLGLGCLVLATVSSSGALVIYMVLLGISTGINSSLYGTLWPEVYGTKNLGSIRSIVTAMMVFASALGPGIVGLAIDLKIGISSQFLTMTAFCFIGTIALMFCSSRYSLRIAKMLADPA